MKFTKMHGCGNDYIYVDCTREPLADPNGVALRLSDRHFGIGVGRSDFDLSLRQGGLPHGHVQLRWQRGGYVRQRDSLCGQILL